MFTMYFYVLSLKSNSIYIMYSYFLYIILSYIEINTPQKWGVYFLTTSKDRMKIFLPQGFDRCHRLGTDVQILTRICNAQKSILCAIQNLCGIRLDI